MTIKLPKSIFLFTLNWFFSWNFQNPNFSFTKYPLKPIQIYKTQLSNTSTGLIPINGHSSIRQTNHFHSTTLIHQPRPRQNFPNFQSRKFHLPFQISTSVQIKVTKHYNSYDISINSKRFYQAFPNLQSKTPKTKQTLILMTTRQLLQHKKLAISIKDLIIKETLINQ